MPFPLSYKQEQLVRWGNVGFFTGQNWQFCPSNLHAGSQDDKKRLEAKMDLIIKGNAKILQILLTERKAVNERHNKIHHTLVGVRQNQKVLDAKWVKHLKFKILSSAFNPPLPFRYLGKMEKLVNENMPISSDDSMKLIFGDQRVWPSAIAWLQTNCPEDQNGPGYEMFHIRELIFDKAYCTKRVLSAVGRRRGEDVSTCA